MDQRDDARSLELLDAVGSAARGERHQPDQAAVRPGPSHAGLHQPSHSGTSHRARVYGLHGAGRVPVDPVRSIYRHLYRESVVHQDARGHADVEPPAERGGPPVGRGARRAAEPQRAEPDRDHPLHRYGPRSEQLRQPTGPAEHRRSAVSAQPQLLVHHQRGVLTMTPFLQTIAFLSVRTRHMRKLAYLSLALSAALSCRDPNVPDLNNPSLDDLTTHPTPSKVAAAAQGLLVGARLNIAEYNGYVSELGLFGRESYIFDPGDNRFETELLFGPLDPGGPRFGGNLWVVRFANIRAANNLLAALGNSALIGLSAAEKEATTGFAQTIQALDFLEVINTRDTIGAPIAVDTKLGDPPAPIQPRDSVFNHIVRLLDSADTHLAAGSPAFPFQLSAGFSGFDTPASLRKFNRALKARVQVYRGAIFACAACFTDALTLLTGATFIDTTPGFSFDVGVYHSFGTGSGDLTNGLYDPTQAKLYAHASLYDSAETQNASTLKDRRFL